MRKILVAGLFVALASGIAAVAIRAQSGGNATQTKEVQMTAKKYDFSPSTVEVSAGTKIIFKITAEDREHGFQILRDGARRDDGEDRRPVIRGGTPPPGGAASPPGGTDRRRRVTPGTANTLATRPAVHAGERGRPARTTRTR
jgi:hypothetical protein